MDGRAREGRGTTLACGEWGETRAMRALHELTIVEAGEALRAGSVTATALTEAVLARIEATEPTLNAYITVTAEMARAQAAAVEVELRAGIERGPLQGIPFAYKDLFDTAGVRTTAGSKYLAERGRRGTRRRWNGCEKRGWC